MKYYDRIPENFLLLRFVVTRYCNYRCPYCYLPNEKLEKEKTMFSLRSPEEWIRALEVFRDRHLELYFTGGEPLLVGDFLRFLGEMVRHDWVRSVRIDSNLSRLEPFLERVRSEKVRFLASFHPSRVSLETFLGKAERLRQLGMMGMVNVVASRENVGLLGMAPHALAARFEQRGCFLNVAKDFHRGLRFGYDPTYREYVDRLQHPRDNDYMNLKDLNTGRICGAGRHYLSLSRRGNAYACGGREQGNVFEGTVSLPGELAPCLLPQCTSIISYSFSSSNDFSPVAHLEDYVRRNREHRKRLDPADLERIWARIGEEDLLPKEEPEDMPTAGGDPGRGAGYIEAIRRVFSKS